MGRVSNRDTILSKGIDVLRRLGYNGSSVRDISEAAGVPLGSFTNNFVSKEAFTLEALNIYFETSKVVISDTLLNDKISPLKRIELFIDTTDKSLNTDKKYKGCLIANLSIEASEHSEVIRARLEAISKEIEQALTLAIKAAVKAGELDKNTDVNTLAGFIVFAQHGAYLQTKVDQTSAAIDRLKKVLFNTVLRK